MARTIDPQTRPALLGAARRLFYSRGVAGTAVDDVAAASRLTKPTLYRHFASKDELVRAYLDDRHEQLDVELRNWIDRSPRQRQPQAVIDWLCNWLAQPDFNGCAFVRAYAELPGDKHVRAKARKRKRVLLHAILEACRAADARDPEALARQLALIVEGATTIAFVVGSPEPAVRAARELAEAALKAAELVDPNV